jgi:hypothetical protein
MFMAGKINVLVAKAGICKLKQLTPAHGDAFLRSGKAAVVAHNATHKPCT